MFAISYRLQLACLQVPNNEEQGSSQSCLRQNCALSRTLSLNPAGVPPDPWSKQTHREGVDMSDVKERPWVQLHTLIPYLVSIKAKRDAKAAGLNLSAYVGALIEGGQVVHAKDDLRPELSKLNAWLGRLNSNINMLSKYANTHRQGACADLLLMRLNEIRKEARLISHKANGLQPRPGRRKRTHD
ncbi:hypothetical protein D3C80_1383500 [compost metagenome]